MPEDHHDRSLVLASDAEREQVALRLRDAAGEGRLTFEELAGRLDETYGARTLTDLELVTRDLPARPAAAPVGAGKEKSSVVAIMSGAQRKGRWRLGRRCRAVAVMGGCKLDLRGAELTVPDPVIRAVSIMGGIEIVVPEGIAVELTGLALMGGKSARIKDVEPQPGAPRLRVRVFALMGGVTVRSKGASHRRRSVPPGGTSPSPSAIDDVEVGARSERRDLLPASAPDGTVTILFSDIEESTELNARLGDERWLEVLRVHHEIVRGGVREHGGFEVKVQGDGFMIAFPSARQAAHCALAIQRAIEANLGALSDGPIRVRIGLHAGDVLREDDDFYGRNVTLAARVAQMARAGEVLASTVVKHLADNGGDIAFEDERVVQLKGLGEETIYSVVARGREGSDGAAAPIPPPPPSGNP